MILWRGHCSVHGRFSERNVTDIRAAVPGVTVLVHPECKHEVVTAADMVGSTEYIIKALDAAEPGIVVGDRHRAQPGPPARSGAPGQERPLPRLDGLLLLDDEPHRPAAPRLGDGVAASPVGPSTRSSWTPTTRTGRASRSTRCSRCPGTERVHAGTACASGSSCSTTPRSSTSSARTRCWRSGRDHSDLQPEVVTFSLDGGGVGCAKGLRLVPGHVRGGRRPAARAGLPRRARHAARCCGEPEHLAWVREMRATTPAASRACARARSCTRRPACSPAGRRRRTGPRSTSCSSSSPTCSPTPRRGSSTTATSSRPPASRRGSTWRCTSSRGSSRSTWPARSAAASSTTRAAGMTDLLLGPGPRARGAARPAPALSRRRSNERSSRRCRSSHRIPGFRGVRVSRSLERPGHLPAADRVGLGRGAHGRTSAGRRSTRGGVSCCTTSTSRSPWWSTSSRVGGH